MSLELNGIITIDKLARYHEKIAAKYASTSDLENYATEEYVDEAIANIEHPIPETSNSHQYLTTNGDGETVWENKLAYSQMEEQVFIEEFVWDGTQTSFPMSLVTAKDGEHITVYINDVAYPGVASETNDFNTVITFDEGVDFPWKGGGKFYVSAPGMNMNLGGMPLSWCVGKMSATIMAEKHYPIRQEYLGINIRANEDRTGVILADSGNLGSAGHYAVSLGGSAEGARSVAAAGYAKGISSFTQGNSPVAYGHYSAAIGDYTVSTAQGSLATGRYNIKDTDENYALIIGNGVRGTEYINGQGWNHSYSNAHTLDWQGNAKFAGDVYVQGTGTEDLQDAKKLATEEYVTNVISQIEIPEASANVNVYEITSDSAVLDELVALLPEGIEIHSGDVMLVTNSMGVKSAYQYDEDWIACDGNVDASKVIMPFDITLAGSYTQVGNLSKTSTGTATFATKGKSVAQAFQEMLSKREQPKIKSNPSVSLTATSGAKEVGTKITPEWSASLNAGSYTYGPATGITASSWEISDTDGNKASTSSGKFAEITVGDTTNYRITAKANYAAGAVAVDNLGDPSNPTIQIAAGSKSANGSYITGYRAWFTYVGESLDTINSAFVRGTTNKGSTPATQNGVEIPAGTKRVMIAIPATSSLALKQVIDVDGMGLDVFGNFTLQTVDVEGLNGYEAKSYNVWVAENTNGMAATHYNFIIE